DWRVGDRFELRRSGSLEDDQDAALVRHEGDAAFPRAFQRGACTASGKIKVGAETSAIGTRDAGAFFPRLGARRLLVLGGLGLFLAGTIFGDVFAVFVLHPNADHIGQALTAATAAVRQHDADAAGRSFATIGGFLENRGTKVDAHAHMIAFG